MSFLHGIAVTEVAASTRTIATVATAVIGLVATAPAADAAAFPLNTPVKVTVLKDAIAAAGATGTLRQALEGVAAQVRAPVVVVRVAPGADAAATDAAVIGADAAGVKSGMQALLAAEAQLGLKPRILGAPGLDTEPVAKALAAVAKKLRARAYAGAAGATRQLAAAYRAKFTERELMLIWPDVTVDGANGDVPGFAVAHALGLRARIDQEQGWHKTLSNVPLLGVAGLTKDVGFDVQDPDCDANVLNAAQVTTLVRLNGELRFWGNRTCAVPEGDFTFESAVATAQILADTFVAGLVWALDKPLTPGLARDIVERLNAKFRELKRGGFVLGAEAEYVAAKNPVEALRQGKLVLVYRYTPVPPLERLGLEQEITDEFFADFTQLSAGAA